MADTVKNDDAGKNGNPNNKHEEKIEIRLSEIGDAKIFKKHSGGQDGGNEIIQIEARKKFKQLIEERLAIIRNLNSYKNDKEEENRRNTNNCRNLNPDFESDFCDFDTYSVIDRRHDTILIDGERGAGKTTFILNMFNEIDHNTIENLDILDPTLIENKEHILINIISRIKKKIDNFFTYKSVSRNVDQELYGYWKKQLSKLAAGLSLLDGIGSSKLSGELWDSPELAMEEGIDNALSGQELEKRFHKFIDASLKVLCKEAFIIFLDDIDTSIDKGFVIMEVLRKYLTSPKLIIVLSGDIKLYSLIVKQLQIDKIDPKKTLKNYVLNGSLGKNDAEIREIEESIDILQDQYITKILKPEFRISLKTILHYKKLIIIINDLFKKAQTEPESKNIEDVLEVFCFNVFSIKKYEVESIRFMKEFVTQLPVRTFLQLIKVYYSYFEAPENMKNNINKLDFITSFISMFVSFFDVKVLSGQSIEGEFVINRISQYLLNESQDYSEEIYKLIPTYSKKKINVNNLIINAILSYILREEPYRIFEYMLKLYLPKYCLESNNLRIFLDKNLRVKTVIDYLLLETDREFMDAAKKSVVFFEGTTNLYPFTSGFIHVNKTNNDEKTIINQSLFLNAILFNISYRRTNSTNLFGSFFSILSIMSEILSLTYEFKDEDPEKDEKLGNMLLEHYNIKTFPSIFDQNYGIEIFNKEDENTEKDKNENLLEDHNEQMKSFLKGLLKWSKLVNKLEPVSTLILNKIWSNFLLNISDIDNQLKNQSDKIKFATILHRYCIAFLNSVYVESQPDKKISKSNPVIDDKVFNDKIKSDLNKPLMDIDDGKKISLFHFIFSCPLWGVYIDFNNESRMTNENANIQNYYWNLQKFIFNEMNTNEDVYEKIFKPITTVNLTKDIKFDVFKETSILKRIKKSQKRTNTRTDDSSTTVQEKVDFRRLTQEAKEIEVKKAMATLKIFNEDIISKNADMERYVYVIRRNVQENFAPRTVPSNTVKAILEKLKKQNQN